MEELAGNKARRREPQQRTVGVMTKRAATTGRQTPGARSAIKAADLHATTGREQYAVTLRRRDAAAGVPPNVWDSPSGCKRRIQSSRSGAVELPGTAVGAGGSGGHATNQAEDVYTLASPSGRSRLQDASRHWRRHCLRLADFCERAGTGIRPSARAWQRNAETTVPRPGSV